MGWRGRLDLWGNDHYLGHIHRSMRFFVRPTHTVILGDHMSSQWIDDVEFGARSKRLEDRVLKWRPGDVMFNITGNHDIGYAGDITQFRVNRWKHKFGPLNYALELPDSHGVSASTGIRVVGINNLLLDGPANDEKLRNETHKFLDELPDRCTTRGLRSFGEPTAMGLTGDSQCDNGATILLMHVPFHKDAGLCTDSPHFANYEYPKVLLREQNHLSPESTKAVLDKVFNHGYGVALSGHDHEGCHTMHTKTARSEYGWKAERFDARRMQEHNSHTVRTIEEVTVRSTMGQYGGNTGVLTADFDASSREWRFQYKAVRFVHNTVWWVVNVASFLGTALVLMTMSLTRTTPGQKLLRSLPKLRRAEGRSDRKSTFSSTRRHGFIQKDRTL